MYKTLVVMVQKLGMWFISITAFSILLLTSACSKDDPQPPIQVQFSVAEQTVTEGNDILLIIHFSRATTQDVTLSIRYSGSAIYGTDFSSTPAGSNDVISLPVSRGASMAQFTVATLNNSVYEGNKLIVLTLENPPAGFILGEQKELELTLIDDEQVALANFQISTATIAENLLPGITVQIPFTVPTKGAGTLALEFTSGNAVYGTNFTTLPIASGNTIVLDIPDNSTGTNLTIVPTDDSYFHDDFVIVFEIISGNGSVRPGTNKRFTLTIKEDEEPSRANFNLPVSSVSEANVAGVVVEIPLSIPTSAAGSVAIIFASSTAVYGTHFTTSPAAAGNQITVNAAQGATQLQFTVFPIDDAVDNDNREVTFTLAGGFGVIRLGTQLTHAVTIVDNEPTLRTVYISFGSATAPLITGAQVWNHAYTNNPDAGTTWSNLLRSDGATTNLGLVINSFLAPQPLGPVTGINSGVFPDNALKEYWYVPGPTQGITRGFSIIQLDNTIAYTIKVLGGTTVASPDGINTLTATIGGEQKSITDITNNVSQVLTWTDKLPSASIIGINLTDTDGGGICPINALEISWYEN